MAQTLPNGTVVPNQDGEEQISETGVSEMRALGASTDAQLGNRALVGHTHAIGDVTGLQSALNSAAVNAAWVNVTGKPSTFPPATHTHTTAQVSGLVAALTAKADVEAVELSSGANANTLTTPGQYVETNASDASSHSNFPEPRAGILDVAANTDRLHVWQLWRPYTGNRLYMRSRTGGTWNSWERLLKGSDLDNAGGDTIYRGIVANGTDIDTVREPGIYTVPTVSVAGTLANWPTRRAGTLIVGSNEGSSSTSQDVIAYVSTTAPVERYTRATLSAVVASWSPWSSSEWTKGTLPPGTDADTFRDPGTWVVASRDGYTGLPGVGTGFLEVLTFPTTGLSLQQYSERTSTITRVWLRTSATTSGFTGAEWTLAAGGAAGDTVYRGALADGTDLNTVRAPGVYTVPSITSARTMVNFPTSRAATLIVSGNTDQGVAAQQVIAHVSNTAAPEQWTRSTASILPQNWGAWSTTEWVKGTLPDGVDVDTFADAGTWAVTIPSTPGWPHALSGVLSNMVIPGSSVRAQLAIGDGALAHRMSRSTGGFSGVAWTHTGGGGAGSSRVTDVQVSDHGTRVEYARSRRGGGTGTNGLPVFMWRFDHWLVAFQDIILPILREFDLPATLNVNYDNLGNPQNGAGSITWSDVQDWNQYDGIEIANHGSTHTNANTMESIYHEIVDGRRNLEAAMPRVAVETWQEHGSAYLIATDLDGDTGLNLGRTPEAFMESYAGRLVMAEHAVVEGKTGSFYPPLTGHPQIGQSHYSMDRQTSAEAIETIQWAQTVGRGLTGYTHPGLMDQVNVGGNIHPATYNEDGSVLFQDTTYPTEQAFRAAMDTAGNIVHMPVKDFRAICEWVAAERDAGRLMVMTAAGGGFADKHSNRRENLLLTDLADWTSTSGWTQAGTGADMVFTSNSSASRITQGMLLHTRFGWAMGAAHELLVHAKADTETTLMLRMEQMGDPGNWATQKEHTIPGDGVLRPYRLNLTLPRDTSVSQMRVYLGGPSMEIHGPPLLAAI